jgi:hypothetical protein
VRHLASTVSFDALCVDLAGRRGRAVHAAPGWAAHSGAALHQIYAKVIAGLESAAHDRIEKAFGWES